MLTHIHVCDCLLFYDCTVRHTHRSCFFRIQVKDLVRGSIECQTHKHLEATYRLLAAKLDVVVLKDRRSKPQRDLLVVFDIAGELLVEVQVRINYACIHRHVQSV